LKREGRGEEGAEQKGEKKTRGGSSRKGRDG